MDRCSYPSSIAFFRSPLGKIFSQPAFEVGVQKIIAPEAPTESALSFASREIVRSGVVIADEIIKKVNNLLNLEDFTSSLTCFLSKSAWHSDNPLCPSLTASVMETRSNSFSLFAQITHYIFSLAPTNFFRNHFKFVCSIKY